MNKQPAQTIWPWLKANLGPRCLAPLTSVDAKALAAAVQIVELYAYSLDDSLLTAFKVVVEQMQPQTRYLAFHGIAHIRDWSDRWAMWQAAELAPLGPVPRCKFGPQPAPAAVPA